MRKFHPAWLILIACCFLQAGGLGIVINSVGIMIPSVLSDLQFSQGSFMLYLTIQGFCMAAAMPVMGRLLPKLNIRLVVTVGMLLAAGSYAVMGQFTEVWQWYVAGPVLGVAATVFILPTPIMISNWFKKSTGLAMGLAMACSGIAGAVVNPLGSYFIAAFGWRTTYALLAGIACALVLPFSLFVMRFKPADAGVAAYGAEETDATRTAGGHVASEELPGVSAAKAVKSLSFVCLFFVAGIISLNSSFMQLLPTLAATANLASIAAFLASAAMIGNIVGKLVLGWLNDKLGARNATICGLSIGVVSFVLLLMSLGGNAALAVAGASLFGAMTAMMQVSLPLVVRTAYGPKEYSIVYSYIGMATTLVGSVGLTLIGMSFDAFKSYAPSIFIMMGSCVVAAVLLFIGLALAKHLWKTKEPDPDPKPTPEPETA